MSQFILGPGGLRFILSALVVIEHISHYKVGVVAVMTFFVLSGYWVTLVYERSHAHAIRGVPTFYLSRAMRVFPLYLVIFLVVAALASLIAMPLQPDVWMALPILGVASHGTDIIGVTWSLDIELQFYLLLPLLIMLLRWPGRRQGQGWRILAGALLLSWFLGLVLASRYGMLTVLLCLPIFLFGVATHLFDFKIRRTQARMSLLLFFLMGLVIISLPGTRDLLLHGRGSRLSDALFAMYWCIPLLPFIAYNVRQPSDARDRFLGDLFYPIYLVHFPLATLAAFLLGRDMANWEKLVYLGAVLLISVGIYHLVDRWSEAFRHRFIRQLLGRQGHARRSPSVGE